MILEDNIQQSDATIEKTNNLHQILKNTFGYSTFRPGQEEIIHHVLNNKDCLIIMPTGGGKSMCYQLPALVKEGLTVVISPLIALMNDQVQALKLQGVKVANIHSNMDSAEMRKEESLLVSGEAKLLYISPERAITTAFSNFLQRLPVSLIAIDEAHCVSVWGNDFRPDYVQLSKLREAFPNIPCIALTATADAATQQDIIKQLHLRDPKIFLSSFERTNITTYVVAANNKVRQVSDFLRQVKDQAGIIYCLSRKETESLSEKMRQLGYNCAYYHAGMDAQERQKVQKEFQDDSLQFICATIAFGMGVDKSNIRWVIHYAMPKNLEGYYQEIGRSGRDGSPAKTLLLFGWGDYLKLKMFIDDSEAETTFKEVQYAKLERMWEFANAHECRTNVVLNYFGEYRNTACGHCDNCITPPKKFEATIIAQKALSAILRTNEKASLNLLIDILRGSNKAEILSAGYDRLKTFGAGRDISFIEWKVYITQLINLGYIKTDYTDHFHLKVTPLSNAVLFENKPVNLVNFVPVDLNVAKTKPKPKPAIKIIEEELLAKLKEWRTQKARDQKVPAYIVLNDKTIENIILQMPTSSQDLLSVEGIGNVKMEQYGADLIKIIQDYIISQEHKKNIKGKTYLETKALLNQGHSIAEIAKIRELSEVTIFSHIAHLYTTNDILDVSPFVSTEEINEVKTAWEKGNKAMELATIAEHLTKPMDFGKIRISLAVLLKSKG